MSTKPTTTYVLQSKHTLGWWEDVEEHGIEAGAREAAKRWKAAVPSRKLRLIKRTEEVVWEEKE